MMMEDGEGVIARFVFSARYQDGAFGSTFLDTRRFCLVTRLVHSPNDNLIVDELFSSLQWPVTLKIWSLFIAMIVKLKCQQLQQILAPRLTHRETFYSSTSL